MPDMEATVATVATVITLVTATKAATADMEAAKIWSLPTA